MVVGVATVIGMVGGPTGATIAYHGAVVDCHATLVVTRKQLKTAKASAAASFDAYEEQTNRIENARPLLREQILDWHRAGVPWSWIKTSSVGRAFYEQLYGT